MSGSSPWRRSSTDPASCRFLGIWLAINGTACLSLSCTGISFREHYGRMFALAQPALPAEFVLMLWLVKKGAAPRAMAVA